MSEYQPITEAEQLFADDVYEKVSALNIAIGLAHDAGLSVSFGLSSDTGRGPAITTVYNLQVKKPGNYLTGLRETPL